MKKDTLIVWVVIILCSLWRGGLTTWQEGAACFVIGAILFAIAKIWLRWHFNRLYQEYVAINQQRGLPPPPDLRQ